MKIKVQCPCGTRFEFEVEPVNGRMPLAINCPTCGADATALANRVIEQQSEVADLERMCPKHPSEPATETCRVCGKPICLKCMALFGYVCSAYCRQQAAAKRIAVPVYAQQKSVMAAKAYFAAKCITWTVTVAAVLVIGFWIWYAWFAREPKVVWSLPIPVQDADSGKAFKPDEFYQLIGPGEVLSIKSKQVSLFDVTEQKSVWATPLQTETDLAAIKAARDKNEDIRRRTPKVKDDDGNDVTRYKGMDPLGFEDDFYFAEPKVIATVNDIWILFSDHLFRFDRKTGVRKETPIPGPILQTTFNNDAILVLSGKSGDESITEISLPEGTAQSEVLTVPAPATASATPRVKNTKAPVTSGKYPAAEVNNALQKLAPNNSLPETDWSGRESQRPFVAAGPNVVQVETQLLEHKTIAHAAMKAKGKSVLDSGNLTASQGLDVAQEMMNDSRREQTGGVVEEDVSRYQVTLHRRFAKDIPDWSGEVTGPPQFFPLKTVDILAAGQTIYVFDKGNKKLWEAKLTFPIAANFSSERVPALETGEALYFADLGMLTRFDLKMGSVRWRYNTVGISKIQVDAHGDLYVDTTTAGPEAIEYSQQVNLQAKVHPLIVKLAPETGKVRWQVESVGDNCLMSGKFLYATRQSQAYALLRLEDGPDTHYFLNLLNPANGKEIWNWHRGNHRLVKTEVEKNWILIQFEDQVMVMKFFSF